MSDCKITPAALRYKMYGRMTPRVLSNTTDAYHKAMWAIAANQRLWHFRDPPHDRLTVYFTPVPGHRDLDREKARTARRVSGIILDQISLRRSKYRPLHLMAQISPYSQTYLRVWVKINETISDRVFRHLWATRHPWLTRRLEGFHV